MAEKPRPMLQVSWVGLTIPGSNHGRILWHQLGWWGSHWFGSQPRHAKVALAGNCAALQVWADVGLWIFMSDERNGWKRWKGARGSRGLLLLVLLLLMMFSVPVRNAKWVNRGVSSCNLYTVGNMYI